MTHKLSDTGSKRKIEQPFRRKRQSSFPRLATSTITKPQSWPPNSLCSRSAPSKSNLTSFSTPSRRQSLAELARVDADGTRTLDWDSEHQRLPLKETTSVCGAFSQAIAIISVDRGLFMVDDLLLALRAIERKRHADFFLLLQIRSAHSLGSSPSVVVSLPVPLFPPRCTAHSSSAENTSISSPSTPDTRRDTRILLRTFRQLSVSRRVIKLPLDNADR